MNYFIQGDAANADKIKAAFENEGYCTRGWNYNSNKGIYFTHEPDDVVDYTSNDILANIIKTHPDYKELELPKPHYDISNFKPFDKVLVRDRDESKWGNTYFGFYDEDQKVFVCDCYEWEQCIPFNDDNKHLIGTTDMPSEEYINW